MEKVVKLSGILLSLVFSLVLITTPSISAGNKNPGKPVPKAKSAPKVKVDVKPSPKKPAPKKIAKPAPKKPTPKKITKPTPKKKPTPRPKTTKKQPKPKVVKIRAKDIYLGRYKGFRKAAVLDTQKVFNAISYYQELKRAGLNKKSGRYWILIQKSNRIFYKALRKMAKDQGYDLIGAQKSILIDGTSPPDLTAKLIQIIPEVQLY